LTQGWDRIVGQIETQLRQASRQGQALAGTARMQPNPGLR
jgi:hypothetical protein